MPAGPGRRLSLLLQRAEVADVLKRRGDLLPGEPPRIRIALDVLEGALAALVTREGETGAGSWPEDLEDLIWVLRRAREEGGQSHVTVRSPPRGPPALKVVKATYDASSLVARLQGMRRGDASELLFELQRCWPLVDLDVVWLRDRLVSLLSEPSCVAPAAWLLGRLRASDAAPALLRTLRRVQILDDRLALIEALVQVGDRDSGMRTLRSILAHGDKASHPRTIDTLVAVAEVVDVGDLLGMLPLVSGADAVVLGALVYRLGGPEGYQVVARNLGALLEQQPSEPSPSHGALLTRALQGLMLTRSTRFAPLAERAISSADPWPRAVAREVVRRLADGLREATPEELLERAEQYGGGQDTEGALAQVEELLSIEPTHSRGLYLQAFLLKELDRTQDALEASRRALEIEPSNWQVQRLIGSLHWDAGNGEAALVAYDRAIGLCPTDGHVWYYKGYVLYRLGRFDESLPCLDRALTLQPDSVFILNQKGFTLSRMGRSEEAVLLHRDATRLEPGDTRTLEYLAQALHTAGALEEALLVFERILRREPGRLVALLDRAALLMELRRWAKATEAFGHYLSEDDESFRAWFDKGLCHRRLEEPAEAAQCFRRALRLVPESRKARSQLERCLRQLRDP